MLTGDPDLARYLAMNDAWPDLEEPDQAMLGYAAKLTRRPGEMEAGDVDMLRTQGFDDRGILDICQVVCYYNYVNRLADGLGVELEASWEEETLTVTREELDARRRARSTDS